MRRLAVRVLAKWPRESSIVPTLEPLKGGDLDAKPHDAYHPVGTCRMGSDQEAVVDLDLRVRHTGNLWVLSTAVFPSAGSANPTFSMLCLGEKLSEVLGAKLDEAQC
jgi:choline dehydrogenase-like flavoprotein